MMDKYENDLIFDNIFRMIGVFALVAGLVILLMFLTADKTPDYYYLQVGLTDPNVACVVAASPWSDDARVYCSNEPDKVFDFLKRANEDLKKVKGK